TELPHAFQEAALIDRFHGFIKGWDSPRMRENMKAMGWALNVEYFSEVLHALRKEVIYTAVVDAILEIPKSSDTRDTTAIKRICSGLMKLLFPHVKRVEDVNKKEFQMYCLDPALQMRNTIKRQLHIMDSEYSDSIPNITIR
ncbi:MAG: BREX system Lon protease-like protein BrxL, partial [Dethiobacteria bacterium]